MKQLKKARTLEIYAQLCEGRVIDKAEIAKKFGVDERSIQRDIDDIRAFIDDYSVSQGKQNGRSVVYDRLEKGYRMVGNDVSMSNSEILAVSKILLESRAFEKKEISSILEKLIDGCASPKSKKLVEDAVRNEKFHYVELYSKPHFTELLWEINENVQHYNLMEIVYEKAVSSKETVTRTIEPMAVLFSEYYFYLNAYIVEKNNEGKYVHSFEYPTVFRIDRIKKQRNIGLKFKIAYANRFEEGEYRKRIHFMQAGNLHKCRFYYKGRNKEAVFDRFPTAILISEDEKGCIFEVETYGRGIMMWLLSQGANAVVLEPKSFRERMKQELQEMLDGYM